MFSVLLIWCYMLITTFFSGYALCMLGERVTGYRIRHKISIFFAGIVFATVYAQIFSLFAKVGLAANVVLLLFCIVTGICFRKKICEELGTLARTRWIVAALLMVLMAYGASRGYIHYDTGLYHAQSIRWIEEYGVVKGLGDLHCRLAYNSASFALSALYSMAFLGGRSYHACAGFLALLVAWECMDVFECMGAVPGMFRRGTQSETAGRRFRRADIGRLFAIYYLLIIFDEMVSPASDYFMVLTAFFLVIRWLELREDLVEEPEPYGMLCVLGVYLLTIKLSAALILLLVLRPAILLIREKKWKTIGSFLMGGLVVAVPYFVRNVVISGWLVYPFTSIDLFSVDWKIPKGLADYDAHEIQVWGRGYTDVSRYHIPIGEWIGDWFRSQSGLDRVFILGAIAGCVLLVIGVLLYILVPKLRKDMRYLPEEAVLSACFLFWLLTSPLMRYGCVYVWLAAGVIWGDMLLVISAKKRQIGILLTAMILLFGGYKGLMFGKEIIVSYRNENWILQKDYENYPVEEYDLDGVTIYVPVEGDRTGYDAFPSTPDPGDVGLRGTTLGDGFVIK